MSDRAPLLPDDWDTLAPLIDRLLDAPSSERPALLAQLAGDNAARRGELERLLAECEREDSLLDEPAAARFAQLREEEAGPSLPEVLGGQYRIEREVGRGGMARVYLAQDVRHARRVAVKVIRHEIASSLMRDRFLREIGIAARLRHPNIMPLYDSGDADGLLYFVMPYEDGKSLRARLDQGRGLGIAEGVSILRDVARALACAHEQGVVHRDIKPDNVLLSGDAAVVTDFGIAKAFTVAATDVGNEAVTQAGAIIGTAAYMAPEQAIGDPATDHRADIYAFGCLAYELFAGAPPFSGTTAHQVISAHLSDAPRPLDDHRRDVPPNVLRLIARCLEKSPDARPGSAAELLEVLGTMTAPQEPVVAWRRPRYRWLTAAAIALGVIVLGGLYAERETRGGPVTIAVLPLEVAGDSAQDLAAGFTEDLANALVRIPWLRLKSRGGASNYRGLGDVDARTWGDSLGVQYLLTGSFRNERGSIAVTLQLLRTEDGSYVWGDKFTPVRLDMLRDLIVGTIGDSLRPYAGRFAKRFRVDTTSHQYASTDDAYTLYLKGKQKLAERGPSIRASIDFFREAKRLDSTYAEAWSGLSLALAASVVSQLASINSVRAEAIANAERAMQLDSTLAEPRIALGLVHTLDWEWDKAEAAFKAAVERNPHDAEVLIPYARLLILRHRLPDALQQVEAALANDRQSSLVLSFKAFTYALQGDSAGAHIWSNRALGTNPKPTFITRIFSAMALVRANSGKEARQLVQDDVPPLEPYSLYVLAASGDRATVQSRLATLAGGGITSPSAWTAQAYAYLGLGDTAKALDALDSATVRHEPWPTISYPGLPALDAVRDNSRFHALLTRVGLPPP